MKPCCIIILFALLTHASMALAQVGPPAEATEPVEISPDVQELLDAIEALPEDASPVGQAIEEAAVLAAPTFQGRDIGAVSAAGSFTQNGDSFLVSGSGEDIYWTRDEFFYAYTQMTGDFTAIVRVLRVDNTNPWAKAGLMVRQSLNADSPNFMVFVNPAGDAGVQARSTVGGNTDYQPGGSVEQGRWIKLTRQGNTLTAYRSTQPGDFVPPPTHFDPIGSTTISLSSSVYIGLAVTSHADGILCNAGFERLNIFSSGGGGGGGSGWNNQDIGNVSAAGSFGQSESGSTFIVSGSGFDIWGSQDEFHYAYQTAPNDVQILARVLGIDNTNPWAKAGVMIRQTLADSSPNVLLALTPSHGLAFQWRATAGGPTFYIDAGPASGPVWVKLVKSGNTFTGYRSVDPVNWTQVATVTFDMGTASVMAGLAVTSHNDGVLARGNFDTVAINAAPGGGGTNSAPAAPSGLTATATSSDRISLTWQDNATNETGFILERSTNGTAFVQIGTFPADNETAVEAVVPGTHHWYRVAATNAAGVSPYSNIAEATTPTTTNNTTLPPPWQDRDIGTSGGSATYTNGRFTVIGSGADIYGNSDQFNFAYQPASGDQTIIAALDSIYPVSGSYNPWARIGLMIRETLDPNAKNAMVFFSAQHGTGFTWREATGGTTQYIPGNSWTRFLRLDRRGNTFTAYWSPDENSWQLIGSATINIANSVYIGLAVTSHNTAGKVAGEFSQVSVTVDGGGGGSALPAPWASQDVGAVGVAGSAAFSQGTFTVKGSGADIWGSADAFHFVYLTVTGPGELVARVTGLEGTNPWAKAGIMVRRSQLAESANVFAMATAAHGIGLQARLGNGSGTSYVPGPFWTAPVWLKLRRSGDVVTGFASLDGTTWTMLGTQSIPMLDPILIGLAVTSHNNSVLNTATFDNVSFTFQ